MQNKPDKSDQERAAEEDPAKTRLPPAEKTRDEGQSGRSKSFLGTYVIYIVAVLIFAAILFYAAEGVIRGWVQRILDHAQP